MNINHNIRFRLTPEGERAIRDHYADVERQYPSIGAGHWFLYHPADAEGWRQEQLWQVMAMLGPKMSIAGPQLIGENEIQLVTEDY